MGPHSGGRLHRPMIGDEARRINALPSAGDRRGVIRALAGLIGILSLGPSIAVRKADEPTVLETWLRRHGADVLGDTTALGRFGTDYLAQHPEDRDAERLSRLVVGEGTLPIRLRLIENIARDWRVHDAVVVEGWVFARTEARICAALHLMGGAAA